MFKYDLLRDGITQSVIGKFLSCNTYTKLTLLEAWTSRSSKPHLQFGDLTHNILEYIYKRWDEPPTKQDVIKVIHRVVTKWKDRNKNNINTEFLETLEYQQAVLVALLPQYFLFYSKKDFHKTKWVACEKEFCFYVKVKIVLKGKLVKLRIPVRGKIDAVQRKLGLWVFETKTKAMIDEWNLQSTLGLDFQTGIYTIAVTKLYKEFPEGTRYNVIRRPGNKPKKNETLVAFSARLEKAIAKNPKYYFIRYTINRTEKDYEEIKDELRRMVKAFVLWYYGLVPTYKNTNSCTNKYGVCAMLPVCAHGNYQGLKKREKPFSELDYRQEA